MSRIQEDWTQYQQSQVFQYMKRVPKGDAEHLFSMGWYAGVNAQKEAAAKEIARLKQRIEDHREAEIAREDWILSGGR